MLTSFHPRRPRSSAERFTCGEEHSREVDVEDRLPLVERVVVEWCHRTPDPGVRERSVKATEVGHRLLDGTLNDGLGGDVRLDGDRLRIEGVGYFVSCNLIDIDAGDSSSRFGEAFGIRAADTTAGTGDESNGSGEIELVEDSCHRIT